MAQKSATIAIVKDNKVLLLKRGDTAPWMPNKYCLVGGGVDENESLIDAVIRESQEEIGVSIQKSLIESFVVTYKNNYSKTVFLTKVSDLNIRLNYEHSDHIWCDYDSCEKLYNQKIAGSKTIFCYQNSLCQKNNFLKMKLKSLFNYEKILPLFFLVSSKSFILFCF